MTTYLYFCRSGDRIKIGISKNVEKRLKDIGLHLPAPPTLIGSIEASYAFEKAVHSSLKAWRLDGEWFSASEEVVNAVGAIMDDGYAALNFTEPEPKQSLFVPDEGPGRSAIPALLRLVWPDDALAELQALTGESEEVCRGWMADGNSISDLVTLALTTIIIRYMMGGTVMSFRKKEDA